MSSLVSEASSPHSHGWWQSWPHHSIIVQLGLSRSFRFHVNDYLTVASEYTAVSISQWCLGSWMLCHYSVALLHGYFNLCCACKSHTWYLSNAFTLPKSLCFTTVCHKQWYIILSNHSGGGMVTCNLGYSSAGICCYYCDLSCKF